MSSQQTRQVNRSKAGRPSERKGGGGERNRESKREKETDRQINEQTSMKVDIFTEMIIGKGYWTIRFAYGGKIPFQYIHHGF